LNRNAILNLVQSRFPNLLALYAFGSRVTGGATAESDLDLAILVDGLVDLRAASTVMQYQIITSGERLWQRDSRAALYEATILNMKTALDEARAGLIGDILKRGTVYGR